MKKRTDYPMVSVIIPVYNGEKFIDSCLSSITGQSYPPEKTEVIVVDNGSCDNTASMVKAYDVHCLRYTNKRGPAAARNKGVECATGHYLLFIDIDCVAEKGWIEKHVRAHLEAEKEDERIRVVGGSVGGINRNFWAECDDICSWHSIHPGQKRRIEPRYLPTCNLSVRASLMFELGGFDEDMLFGEDVAFCQKALKKGYKILFDPKAEILHINRSSFRHFMKHARQWAQIGTQGGTGAGDDSGNTAFLPARMVYKFYFSFQRFWMIISSWIPSKKMMMFVYFPFIVLNRIYFSYHKLRAISGKSKQDFV